MLGSAQQALNSRKNKTTLIGGIGNPAPLSALLPPLHAGETLQTTRCYQGWCNGLSRFPKSWAFQGSCWWRRDNPLGTGVCPGQGTVGFYCCPLLPSGGGMQYDHTALWLSSNGHTQDLVWLSLPCVPLQHRPTGTRSVSAHTCTHTLGRRSKHKKEAFSDNTKARVDPFTLQSTANTFLNRWEQAP